MNHTISILVGLIFVIFAAIYPLPAMLAISGIAWRIIIGLLGCALFALGIYKTVCKK